MDDLKDNSMGFLNRLFGSAKHSDDESLEEQKQDLLKYSPFSGGVINKECDQIPSAYGPFGITPTNPIPVNGVIGEMVYLFRLRSRTGVGFYYHRLGHISSPPSSNPIDHYELVAADASEWCNLFFDCYYPRRSTKTPNGFTLLSWNSLDDQLKMMAKLPVGGVNIKINNFPYGLPDAIEVNKILNDIYPDLGSAVAKKIRIKMNEYKGKWERSKLAEGMQKLAGDNFVVTKEDNGMIRISRNNLESKGSYNGEKSIFLSDYMCEKCGNPMFIEKQGKDIYLKCSYDKDICGNYICSNDKLLNEDGQNKFILADGSIVVNVIHNKVTDQVCKLCGNRMIECDLYYPKHDMHRYLKYCSSLPKCKNISHNRLPN